jgi:hypothetical protein
MYGPLKKRNPVNKTLQPSSLLRVSGVGIQVAEIKTTGPEDFTG